MSLPDATRRFMDAARTFRGLEERLRGRDLSVDPRAIDEVLIDIEAAIPGLTELDLGRALVFEGYALWWKYMAVMRADVQARKRTIFDAGAGVDPGIAKGYDAATKGQKLIQQYGEEHDRAWADDVVKKLGAYANGA